MLFSDSNCCFKIGDQPISVANISNLKKIPFSICSGGDKFLRVLIDKLGDLLILHTSPDRFFFKNLYKKLHVCRAIIWINCLRKI